MLGCCPCCGGTGADLSCGGACFDCLTTGCAHADPCIETEKFWDDLAEDLLDPVFRENFLAALEAINRP